MESSDSLVEEASKLRNRMCNGPVVADDGLVWRVTMWGGESCGQELRKGPSEDQEPSGSRATLGMRRALSVGPREQRLMLAGGHYLWPVSSPTRKPSGLHWLNCGPIGTSLPSESPGALGDLVGSEARQIGIPFKI